MTLADRFRLWRAHRAWVKGHRQIARCAAGRHHWKSLTPDRVRCCNPGCGKWYGAADRPLSATPKDGTE